MAKFTYAGGREIHYDGRSFISVNREGDTSPFHADEAVKLIVKLLNKSRTARSIASGQRRASKGR